MDETEFWDLIEHSKTMSGGNLDRQIELLIEALGKLGLEEVLAFDKIQIELMDRAYIADLWDAAEIIGCGCGDDGFMDFRAWLIGQGKEIYERVLDKPESLTDILDVSQRFEIQYGVTMVQFEAFRRLTGSMMPPRDRPLPKLKGKTRNALEKRIRFPQLIDKFGDCFE